MNAGSYVREILDAIAEDEPGVAEARCDALRQWVRSGSPRPYGWTADQCAAFVALAMNAANTLRCDRYDSAPTPAAKGGRE